MAEFDAILFDAGGVLLLPNPATIAPVLAPFGAATDEPTLWRAHFVGAHAMDHARSDGHVSDWTAYHRAYVAAAGVVPELQDDAYDRLVAGWSDHYWDIAMPGATEVLRVLAERGVPIGIVSNASGQVEGDLAAAGICGVDTPGATRVLCVVDSFVVGVAKPDPAIFDTALAVLGLPASPRIAYVGDTVFYDVRASTAAGLTPLLHDPYGLHSATPHPSGPHQLLPRLDGLLDLV